MLLSDFYQLDPVSTQSLNGRTTIEAKIMLNPAHAIFKGHFPDMPIVPGVCMVQMVKEVVERHLNKKLLLTSGGSIKFLATINPEIQQQVRIEVQLKQSDRGTFEIEGKLYENETVFFKMKAEFFES